MTTNAEDRLAPTVKRLALVFALAVTTVPPAGYFGVKYADLVEHVQLNARIKADAIDSMVVRNPEMWVYELQRMEDLLPRFPVQPERERVTVRTPAGAALVSVGADPATPVLSRSAAITDSGLVVGQVEIARSYRDLLIDTLVAALAGLLLGTAVYATLAVLPLRALHRVTAAWIKEKDALAESEARFRSLTQMSSDYYWESDAAHRLSARSARKGAAESVFQQASPISHRRWDLPYLSPDASGWQKHRELLAAHLPFRDFEFSRLAADGSERYISISGDPVFATSGEFTGYRGVGTDITERKRAQAALAASEARFRSLTELSSDWYWEQDEKFRFVEVSSGLRERTGNEAHLGKTRWELPCVGVSEERWARHRADLEAHRPFRDFEYPLAGPNGALIYISASGRQIFDEHGKFKGYRGAGRDITERKRAEADLRIAATAFEAQEGMFVTDADNVILRVNRAFTEITGYSAAEAIGLTPHLLDAGRHDAAFYRAMWESIQSCGNWKGEIWNRRKNGEVYPEWLTVTAVKDDDGKITHYVATLTDITRRKAAEEEIRNLAFFDPLTQLPNRRLLMDRLHQALASSERSRHCGALLFVDLDHFKTLNDSLGHDMGDLLLQQVAQRLAASVRASDTVARLGGDEFVIMLEDLSERAEEAMAQMRAIGEKILATFRLPYVLAGHQHQSSGSIGIAPFCGHAQSANELLKNADIAMYQAKAAGRNGLRIFEPGVHTSTGAVPAGSSDPRAR